MLQMQLQPKLLILKQENPQVPITVQDHPTPAPAEAVDTVMVDTVVRAVVLKVQTVHHPQAVIQVLHNLQKVLHQVHLNHPVKLDKAKKPTTYQTLSRFIF